MTRRPSAASLTLVGALAALASASPALAAATIHAPASRLQTTHTFRLGRSVGSPTEGHLVGGSHLDDAPYLRIVPAYAAGDVRWGLGPLIALIDRGARAVRHQFPDAVLSVGHISRAGGGDLDRHASHESGRDADIGFYIHGQTGKPLYSDHLVPFRGDGTAPSWPGAYFDDAKNWAFVASLVTDPPAHVTYIFVAAPLRARLLAYAEKIGAPLAARNKAAELMVQPHGSLPHDDHFHVRIGCPAGMTGCIEFPTLSRARRLAHQAQLRARVRGSAAPATHATVHGAVRPAPPTRGGGKDDGSTAHPHDAKPDVHEPAPVEAPSHEDATPPAMMPEPMDDAVDDVDGPLALREAGELRRAALLARLR